LPLPASIVEIFNNKTIRRLHLASMAARTFRRSGCSRHCYPTSNDAGTQDDALNPACILRIRYLRG
jgi:hypothetical protein